ncbi:MAG: hypothetical protein NTV54_04480 [Ignavibacteriales bacterium]|nr:hypothetical protein [Ignavibacteriales bacterium]
MGQQQLILVILGVIIVGIAIAVGTILFKDNAIDQNRSQVRADLGTLAQRARQYYLRPQYLGGGGRSFAGLTKETGIAVLASSAYTNNKNGAYSVKTAGTATELVLFGRGSWMLDDGVNYPEYECTVTATGYTIEQIK